MIGDGCRYDGGVVLSRSCRHCACQPFSPRSLTAPAVRPRCRYAPRDRCATSRGRQPARRLQRWRGIVGRTVTTDTLASLLRQYPGLLALTGAGISVASGLATYRDDDRRWQRSQPVLASHFRSDPRARQRYWARALAGWPTFAAAQPNQNHHHLATLAAAGWIGAVVTQNVDGLHRDAGHPDVIELHGNLRTVTCMDCSATLPRAVVQERLQLLNPQWGVGDSTLAGVQQLADGDAEVPATAIAGVRVPACGSCGGRLKPDVVFFGDNIRPEVGRAVDQALARASGVLVVGSSLSVYSSLRIARAAVAQNKPLIIVNRGATRADNIAVLKLSISVEAALDGLRAALLPD